MFKWFAAVLAVAFVACSGAAQTPTSQTPTSQAPDNTVSNEMHGKPSLLSERAAVVPGDQFLAAFKLDIEKGWHVYWKNQGDSGLPPDVKWKAEGATFGDPMWPTPHAIPIGTLMNYGYETQLILPIQVTVPKTLKPGDMFKIEADASWLICADICIPEPPPQLGPAKLVVSLPVAAASKTDDAGSADITKALANSPHPTSGTATVQHTGETFVVGITDPDVAAAAASATGLHWFPDGQEIEHIARQQFKRGPNGVSVTLKASDFAKPGDQPLSGVIVAEQKDGTRKAYEVKATPGALGAGLADTAVANATGGASAGSGGSSGPAAPAALDGIALLSVLGFAFLGGLVLNLMPCVLPVLSIKAAGLVHTAHDPKAARTDGMAYLSGVLVCFVAFGAILVALRAAGEQAGLGFQLQYAPVTAGFALLIFAVGLNLLGVFEIGASLMGVGNNLATKSGPTGAFFTGLLAAFVGAPCVGPFMAAPVGIALAQPAPTVLAVFAMIGLGLAAPLVLLSFTPALAKMLPKPGKWMETFRQALAFPMFLAALWLLWVLAGQTGPDGVIVVLIGATAFGFAVWLGRKIGGSIPGRVVTVALILAALVTPAVLAASIKAPAGGTSLASEAGAETWSAELVSQHQSEGRVVFVDFTARWCATCQVNKSVAINSEQVKQAFAKHNVAFLVADWTNRDAAIAEELGKHSRAGVPLYLVYPAGGGEPQVLPQILSPGLVAKAVEDASKSSTASNIQMGDPQTRAG